MIYPTRRAIYLLLAGAPMALALGLIRPELWLVAPGWIGVILACLILDTVAGANPRHLTLDARFPHQVGVGDAFELSLTARGRSEEHTSELQSLMRISYAVFCLKKKQQQRHNSSPTPTHNTA